MFTKIPISTNIAEKMRKRRILIADDEKDLCEILQFNLENEGFDVVTVNSAEEALELDLTSFDLFLFDVMMGEISGYKLARIVRENPKTTYIPIIFITAKDSENDTLTGFSIGADDYIHKPFSVRELIARINVVFRRSIAPVDELSYKDLRVDISQKKVFVGGAEIPLTKKEYGILKLLLENKDHVFSREDIFKLVWEDDVYVLDRAIDVNIARLRKKMGDYGRNIIARVGHGYCFETK